MKKSECLVNKCLLGLKKQWDRERTVTDFAQVLPCLSHLVHLILLLSMAIAPFLEQVHYVNSFRQLGRRSKFLPKFFGPWLFSAENNLCAWVAHPELACPEPHHPPSCFKSLRDLCKQFTCNRHCKFQTWAHMRPEPRLCPTELEDYTWVSRK